MHARDNNSNKSLLLPPGPDEVARLAQLTRTTPLEAISTGTPETLHRTIRRRLSPQEIDALVSRYKSGEVVPALSQEYNISASGLRELLRAEGVSLRGHKISALDATQAVELYESGLTIDQVAKQVGYAWGTIRRVLLAKGVTLRTKP